VGEGVRTLRRRDVLRVAGGTTAAVVAAQASGVLPAQAANAPTRTTRVVYRLSTLGQRACNACKAHDANRYYRTANAANLDRAHRGCNCVILSQSIPVSRWNRFFKQAGTTRTVFDLRWPATEGGT
jgi:hypothetical protein